MSAATFRGRDFYNADWYRRYPGAWYPRRWAYGDVWAAATWASMARWFGYGNVAPIYYDYGNNVTYQDNSVYMNGQDMGTADQYYQQAQDLASTGAQAQTTDDDAMDAAGRIRHDARSSRPKPNLILQLAVNKARHHSRQLHGHLDQRHQARSRFRGQEDATSGLDDRRQQGQRDRNRHLQPDQGRGTRAGPFRQGQNANSGCWCE